MEREAVETAVSSRLFDMVQYLYDQREFSLKTFGPGPRNVGIVDHIKKELEEIIEAPHDLEEWIDVVTLALDGAWRAGFTPEQVVVAMVLKLAKNKAREWPDWRTAEPGKAIEHVRTSCVTSIDRRTTEQGIESFDLSAKSVGAPRRKCQKCGHNHFMRVRCGHVDSTQDEMPTNGCNCWE